MQWRDIHDLRWLLSSAKEIRTGEQAIRAISVSFISRKKVSVRWRCTGWRRSYSLFGDSRTPELATRVVEIMKGRNLPLALLLEFVYNFLFNMNGFKTRVGQENKDISNKPSRSNPAHRCPNRGHSSLCPEGNNVHQPFSELIPSSLLSLALFVPNVVRPAFIPLVLVPVICGHKKASAGTTGTAGKHVAFSFPKALLSLQRC